MSLTFGSLFSGIGGLDLGLERAGMTCRWQSEIHPYGSRVLAKHWPDIPNLGDITKIEWSTVERVDVICGGYPCQPFSLAGLRRGERDPRHLWPLFRDALCHLRPRYAVLENVTAHLSLGFGRVLGDLAEIGFDAEWECIPAAAFGAPHIRSRLICVGINTDSNNGSPFRALSAGKKATPSARGETAWSCAQPDVGRVADGIPHRVDRLYGLGNAVVPQVAEHVGRMIVEAAP